MTGRRDEYHRRKRVALLAGGRVPSQQDWDAKLDKARAIAERRIKRLSSALTDECRPTDHEPLEWIPPGHVTMHADMVLGLEVELNDLRETRDRAEQHRMELLALISKARVMPGPGEIDLFKLEDALLRGHGLPRDAESQLLEVVRELIRWRAAGGAR